MDKRRQPQHQTLQQRQTMQHYTPSRVAITHTMRRTLFTKRFLHTPAPPGGAPRYSQVCQEMDDVCPLCWEGFERGSWVYRLACDHLVQTDCHHQYHTTVSLGSWQQHECAICRAPAIIKAEFRDLGSAVYAPPTHAPARHAPLIYHYGYARNSQHGNTTYFDSHDTGDNGVLQAGVDDIAAAIPDYVSATLKQPLAKPDVGAAPYMATCGTTHQGNDA